MRILARRTLRLLRHPATAWLSGVAGVAAAAVWLAGGTQPEAQPVKVAAPAVEVPVRPVRPGDDPRRVTVTMRWGHPAGRVPQAQAMQWDGYMALDCGAIEHVQPLELEQGQGGDHVGPVVRGEAGDERVYWKSQTDADWDGLKAQLAACRGDDGGRVGTLRIVTPQKSYVARLDWSVDDFVSMKVGTDGSSLDVHIAAEQDARAVRGARITAAPVQPQAPVAEVPVDADAAPVH